MVAASSGFITQSWSSTLRAELGMPALGFHASGKLPNTTYEPPNLPASGGLVPLVAGGVGPKFQPCTVTVSPSGSRSAVCETDTDGAVEKLSGVYVSNGR
jgi:hypothetical protein